MHNGGYMGQALQRISMFDPAVFCIRVNGKLSERWSEYFGAQSMSVEEDDGGLCTTLLISEPVDQAALVGMINCLNGMGLPLVSIECVQTPGHHQISMEDHPSDQDDA
jgi:hypothetical protein